MSTGFQRDPQDGHYLWPGYRDNLRPLLWLLRLADGEVRGRQMPVGIIPATGELDLDGVAATPEDLQTILSIDTPRWKQEMKHREQAPGTVRRPARGDLASSPPRRRGPPRRGLSAARPAHRGARGPAGARQKGACARRHPRRPVEQCGVTVHLAESREEVAIYNKLAECTLVAGLASATVIATDGPSDWYPVHTSGGFRSAAEPPAGALVAQITRICMIASRSELDCIIVQ